MAKRKLIPEYIQTELLVASARRCALCYGLNQDYGQKSGQIAHIDQNRENNQSSNLAWLCLEHHDQYDSTTSQSKGITKQELRNYRDALYQQVIKNRTAASETLTSEIRKDSARYSPNNIELRQVIRDFLKSVNPAVLSAIDNGASAVEVMFSLPKLTALQELQADGEFAKYLHFRPNGNVILSGFGNRIGNAINDLNEGGVLQGFVLEPLPTLSGTLTP